MATAIVFIVLIASFFGVAYIFLSTRHRERMGLIDKGMDASLLNGSHKPESSRPAQLKNGHSVKFTLKTGMLIIGTGVGFILSFILYLLLYPEGYRFDTNHELFPLMVVGIVFVCGGLGLVLGYYMGRALDRKDNQE